MADWVIIKMTYKDFTTFKVLYTKGGWRLLSHVKSSELYNGMLKFTGFQDTTCEVDPAAYGIGLDIEEIWNTMKTTHTDSIELLAEQDWTQVEWMTK